MPASRSEGTRRARWGRGREAAGEGGEGRWSTRGRGRVRWTEGSDGQTERWKNGKGEKTMKETPPPKKNGTVEVDMVGGWSYVEGAWLMPAEERWWG